MSENASSTISHGPSTATCESRPSGTSTSTTSEVMSMTSMTPGVPNPGDTPSPTLTSLSTTVPEIGVMIS